MHANEFVKSSSGYNSLLSLIFLLYSLSHNLVI